MALAYFHRRPSLVQDQDDRPTITVEEVNHWASEKDVESVVDSGKESWLP
jgi:hypothetical protein